MWSSTKASPFSGPPPTAPPPHEDHPNIFGWPGKQQLIITLIHRCSLSQLHLPCSFCFIIPGGKE